MHACILSHKYMRSISCWFFVLFYKIVKSMFFFSFFFQVWQKSVLKILGWKRHWNSIQFLDNISKFEEITIGELTGSRWVVDRATARTSMGSENVSNGACLLQISLFWWDNDISLKNKRNLQKIFVLKKNLTIYFCCYFLEYNSLRAGFAHPLQYYM